MAQYGGKQAYQASREDWKSVQPKQFKSIGQIRKGEESPSKPSRSVGGVYTSDSDVKYMKQAVKDTGRVLQRAGQWKITDAARESSGSAEKKISGSIKKGRDMSRAVSARNSKQIANVKRTAGK